MTTINLDGKWTLYDEYTGSEYEATVPGLDLKDLINAGVLPDIHSCKSDSVYFRVSDFDRTYEKHFTVNKKMLSEKKAVLHFDRLDTLTEIYIGEERIACTDNIHLQYDFDIKPFIKEGDNVLRVKFLSLRQHIKKKQAQLKLPYNSNGTTGHPHIRKCACHFGWDFGPELDAQGISGHCEIKFYSHAEISYFDLKQSFTESTGEIFCRFILDDATGEEALRVTLTHPDGKSESYNLAAGETSLNIKVKNPQLWWCAGYGEQPLYTLKVQLKKGRKILHEKTKRTAFRTIELDRRRDKYGSRFTFIVNGTPVFAKGANYIPMDGLYTDITKQRLYEILSMCKSANMNMLRVWGGGFYESDDFYDICDELGILLWQDFAFACCGYPFMQQDFLDNVKKEVTQNVLRLKHHPCLALWCGNNEIESMSMAWLPMTSFISSTGKFFYEILPEMLTELDGVTPYHPTSPSSGEYMKKMNSDSCGDTHIWNVWHGYQDKNYWLKRTTRFCSEFGMQSYPHSSLTPHQKCDMGEERLTYYLTKHFAFYGKQEYKVYLTELLQMEYMKHAVEHFRRISHICSGTLYWQLNDIWPGASWAGLDYDMNKKALMYHTKHFYEKTHLSAVKEKGRCSIYLTSECAFEGKAEIESISLQSEKSKTLTADVYLSQGKTVRVYSLPVENENDTVILMRLKDKQGNTVSENTFIACENKDLRLNKPTITSEYDLTDDLLSIKLSADKYARYVYLDLDGEINNFSDNFFDLKKGEEKQVTIKIRSTENISRRLKIISLYDALENQDKLRDKAIHIKELTRPMALGNKISRYFEQ